MKPEEMKLTQAKLKRKVKEITKENGLFSDYWQPIYDGVADIDTYIKSSPRIMWILKEPYDYINEETGKPQGGGWTLMDDIEKNSAENLNRNLPLTVQRVIYATRGIDTGEEYDDRWDYHHPEMYKYLFQIAYINISKMPAYTSSKDMTAAYNIWKDILREQINLFNPNILIFGNTMKYFKEDLQIKEEHFLVNFPKWVDLYKKGDQLFVDAYHPGIPGSTKDYINSIVNIICTHKI